MSRISPGNKPLLGGRNFGSAVFPSIFLGAVSASNRDPDPSTELTVMVRYSNHEAQTRRKFTVEARPRRPEAKRKEHGAKRTTL
ncbi:MAG TPA: hypothetical protein VGB25_02705 [Candidatus Binatia bacterium]